MTDTSATGAKPPISDRSDRHAFKLHWHVVLTHYPVSAFFGAFLFTALHLVTHNSCFVLAAYVSLLSGAASMVPVTATGWVTWKREYGGSRSTLFLIKIWVSVSMMFVSGGLALYQTADPFRVLDLGNRAGHVLYVAGLVLLMIGAVVEGHWGGKLHHG